MDIHNKYAEVTTFVFDVDGVLTNGNLRVFNTGELIREMNTRDGYALKRALSAGFNVCIITGGSSIGVKLRLEGIGIQEIYLEVMDKVTVLMSYMSKHKLSQDQVVYMGDDLPDFEAMCLVKYKACPKDADHQIKKICDYISPIKGGQGCVRDIIEKVLRIHEKW